MTTDSSRPLRRKWKEGRSREMQALQKDGARASLEPSLWRRLSLHAQKFTALFEMSTGGEKRLLPMEGLRGLAAFLVFTVHYFSIGKSLRQPGSFVDGFGDFLSFIGNIGVDLFFVLSGLLIYGSLIKRRPSYVRYAIRRVERIYPAFLAVFALYLAISYLTPSESKIPHGFWPATTYLTANFLLLPGILPIQPLMSVAWSLSYEALFYILTPIFIELFALRRRNRLERMLFIGLLAAALGAGVLLGFPHDRMLGFIAGMALWEWLEFQDRRQPPRLGLDFLGLILLPTVVVLFGLIESSPVRSLLASVCFFMITAAAISQHGLMARLFSISPFRWFGNMSYSFYLIHGFTLKAFFRVLENSSIPDILGDGTLWLMICVAFLIALLAGAGLFLTIERPLSLLPREKSRQSRSEELTS